MGAKDADGLAGLDEQGFVVFERAEGADDGVEAGPIAGGAAGAAIDDEVIGALGNIGIEVVVEHAQGGFLMPALAGDGGTAGCADDGRDAHCKTPTGAGSDSGIAHSSKRP